MKLSRQLLKQLIGEEQNKLSEMCGDMEPSSHAPNGNGVAVQHPSPAGSGDMSIPAPSSVAMVLPSLTQLLPSPPLLSMIDVPWCLQPLPTGWTEVVRDGNARLLKRFGASGRTMWATATDVPASPHVVAAGLRHVFREWGERDPLVASMR